jgi:hypothetical protein
MNLIREVPVGLVGFAITRFPNYRGESHVAKYLGCIPRLQVLFKGKLPICSRYPAFPCRPATVPLMETSTEHVAREQLRKGLLLWSAASRSRQSAMPGMPRPGSNWLSCLDSISISTPTGGGRRIGMAFNSAIWMKRASTPFSGRPPCSEELSAPRPTLISAPRRLTGERTVCIVRGKVTVERH